MPSGIFVLTRGGGGGESFEERSYQFGVCMDFGLRIGTRLPVQGDCEVPGHEVRSMLCL